MQLSTMMLDFNKCRCYVPISRGTCLAASELKVVVKRHHSNCNYVPFAESEGL